MAGRKTPGGVMCDSVKVEEEKEGGGEEGEEKQIGTRLPGGCVALWRANLCMLSPFPALLLADRQADIWTDGWMDGATDRQANRQTDRQIGRQTGSPLSEAETPGARWLPWIHSQGFSACLLFACEHECERERAWAPWRPPAWSTHAQPCIPASQGEKSAFMIKLGFCS